MEEVPVVSVLIPVFNGERYLREAVESILAQTFRKFEVVIVDDGSTDSTPEILSELRSRDCRIHVLRTPNGGCATALARGLAVARGELIARMDSDDVCHPERIHRQVDFLNNNPDFCVVGSAITIIDPDGETISHRAYPICPLEIEEQHVLRGLCCMAHPATLIRRKSLDEVGGYRPDYEPAEDFDLWVRLGEVGKLGNLEEELLKYRVHPASATSTRASEMVDCVNRVLRETWEKKGLNRENLPLIAVPPVLDAVASIRGFAYVSWESGYYVTAMKHALRQFGMRPFDRESIKCLVRCSLGPLSRPIVRLFLYYRRVPTLTQTSTGKSARSEAEAGGIER